MILGMGIGWVGAPARPEKIPGMCTQTAQTTNFVNFLSIFRHFFANFHDVTKFQDPQMCLMCAHTAPLFWGEIL